MSVQKKELGGKIKSARESANDGRGMSQAELAQLIGIKQASLSEIEVGKSTPRKPTLIALSFVLNDDFGEEWLREFFKSAVNKGVKEFNHAALAELLSKADELDEQAIKEMRHIWDMVGSEIERRKN